MTLYPEARKKADSILLRETNMVSVKLPPEDWFDTSLFNLFMQEYANASSSGRRAIITLGRKVYPTIKKTGLPEFASPVEFLAFEATGFLANHQGRDIIPRKILKQTSNEFIVEAPAPGYDCALFEGVFLGILEMMDVTTGKVTQTTCVKNGDKTCTFNVTW
jgi:hypothetical protein